MIDASEILETEEFTVDVILPNGGGTVKGVFDNEAADPFGINTTAPVVTLATEVADTLVDGAQLIINGQDYFVKPGKTDAEGLTQIPLST